MAALSAHHESGAGVGMDDPFERQRLFDEALDRIEAEGAKAFGDGVARGDCPYRDHPEPHFANTWVSGWVQALLGTLAPIEDPDEPAAPAGP